LDSLLFSVTVYFFTILGYKKSNRRGVIPVNEQNCLGFLASFV